MRALFLQGFFIVCLVLKKLTTKSQNMDELKGIFKNYKPSQKYSEAFKSAVVKDFEEGSFNEDFIQYRYGLQI